MKAANRSPVVVGVKTATGGVAPVLLAAREARLRDTTLHVVHAFVWPAFSPPANADYGTPRGNARRVVDDAVAQATEAFPKLTVTADVVDGTPLPRLLALSRRATLLVAGSDRLGRSVALPADSLAVQLSARAACPVMIASETARRAGPVVVGLDGSPSAAPALLVALEEAALRRCSVIALHSCDTGAKAPCAGRDVTYDALAMRPPRHRDVQVEYRTVRVPPAEALIGLSRHAQLVVVGVRGWRDTLLGPVTQTLLHHAGCPVLVTRVSGPLSPPLSQVAHASHR